MQVNLTTAQSPPPEAYKHGFDGSCAPGSHYSSGQVSFSVGVFQWLPTAAGRGLKRSPVKIRIKGYMSEPERVYAAAREVCTKLDAGWVPDKKSISV